MLKQRIISAIVLLIVVLLALFYFSPIAFAMTVGGITVLAVWEWCQFARPKNLNFSRFMIVSLSACFIFLIIYALSYQIDAGIILTIKTSWLLWIAAAWWIVATALVVTYPKSAAFWKKQPLFQLIFGFCALMPFLLSLVRLRLYQYNAHPSYGLWLLLYVLVIIWSTDSGAYMFGRLFGKHKLAVNVSPGKTWEGALGGIACAMLVAVIYVQFVPQDLFLAQVSLMKLLAMTFVTVVISILGDLTESMFKREAGIKDSSNLIPGHGGILDRIDSLTAALPVFTLMFYLMK